jgi:hypothetical protein
MKNLLAVISAVIVITAVTSLYLYNVISKPGYYFKIGTHNTSNVFLRATPEYEYQVVMEPDSVTIYYLGETIGKLPYESDLGHILLQDNE